MRLALLAILAIGLVGFSSDRSSANVILSYDFNAANDREGWTVSSIQSTTGDFFFENLDQLQWTATGGVGGTGGLSFVEQSGWGWSEAFTAPDEALAAVRDAIRPHLAYDLTNDGSITHQVFLRGASGMLIHLDAGPTGTVLGTYKNWNIDLASMDLTWFRTGSTDIVAYSDVLQIIDSLTGLYIRADHGDSTSVATRNKAIIDNITITTVAVPEPSSLAMMSSGLLGGLGLWSRKRRHASAR